MCVPVMADWSDFPLWTINCRSVGEAVIGPIEIRQKCQLKSGCEEPRRCQTEEVGLYFVCFGEPLMVFEKGNKVIRGVC